jgi:hypothetical protein
MIYELLDSLSILTVKAYSWKMQKEVNSFLDYISWFKLFFSRHTTAIETGRHACQINVNHDNMRGLRPGPYELFSPRQEPRTNVLLT